MKILFILSIEPSTSFYIYNVIQRETKHSIESMLEDLTNLGLVIRLNYSNDFDIMNENNNNLYYLLNWSNPKTKTMLAEYQKESTRKQRLDTIRKVLEYSRKETYVYNRVE